MGKKLTTFIIEGRLAKPDLIKDMWVLRRAFLELKQSEEEDKMYFSRFCQREDTYLLTFFDEEKRLQGFFTLTFKPFSKPGSKALLALSKYYYVNSAYRGHSAITSAAWRVLPKAIWKFGIRPLYVTAFVFPSSYVSLSRTFGGVKTIQENKTTDWEQQILENFAEDIYGSNWDSTSKLVRNQNAPFEENQGKTEEIRLLREAYEIMNPHWRDGVSVPILTKLDFSTIRSILSTSLRRMRRGNFAES